MDKVFGTRKEPFDRASAARPLASDWLWRPWYAKLWWAAIPLWWAGMAAASVAEPLAGFYESAAAGFLNIVFFPVTALMVLGVGYAQSLLAAFHTQSDSGSLSNETAAAIADLWEEHERGMENLSAAFDIHDPRSGGLYVGNPLSLQHPGRRL
ncbi:hypothetical protein SAMN06295912_11255 [Sphingomonas laterariae]|uniref:Uncharacterized protein n=1 Tax=Edaphosphingomonas laterariae TaxID=861865 RepID=A0A239GGH0_9SPHN|nr:hypothetical protein [Sphingomonas laterariae]SNS68131.1 hypothetical protein SAMN06295912_11255 [Sphingomonas laterariae]